MEDNNNLLLSHEEKAYREFITRGDDFYKIELFKNAREMYEEAEKYKPSDPIAKQKISDCNKLLKRDRNRILIILPFLAGLIFLICYYN